MKALKSQINLKIVNNTSLEQQVDILGIINSPNASNNLNTTFEFDFTGQTLGTSAQILYDIVSSTSSILTSFYPLPTIQGYVDALNTLGLGIFYFSGNIIYVNSNTYIFRRIIW
jgi:hypothetical protein